MTLAELLPQSIAMQMSNDVLQGMHTDQLAKLPATTAEEVPDDAQPFFIKIPLVSYQPILAASPDFILVNEVTKRRNQLVLFDENLTRFNQRSFINEPMLDGLWYEDGHQFLLLTTSRVFTFDPNTLQIELIQSILPTENNEFKCFTFLNQSTLLIAYNQWAVEYVEKWQQDADNGSWTLTGKLPLLLSNNEFIGNMLSITEGGGSYLAFTVYNELTEQWRLEMRHTETGVGDKSVLLPGSNIAHDYRVASVKNTESDVKLLVFCSNNSNIIAIDSKWQKIAVNYKHPVQRMALFKENQMIVRTTERVDVHLFM